MGLYTQLSQRYEHDWGEEHPPSCWAEANSYSCLSPPWGWVSSL